MQLDQVKIVADSSSDVLAMKGVAFETAPLKIITAEKEYVDNAVLDVRGMVEELQRYKGKSSTSCPNTAEWLAAFGEARWVFCVTITGTLSGSYNAACMAKEVYEEAHPDRCVFVLNTLSAGPEICLILERLQQLVMQGLTFEEVAERITSYRENTGLLFMLESLQNFAKNGRVSPLLARVVGVLGVRVVGKASDVGDLEPLDKCRGEQKALSDVVRRLEEQGFVGGRVRLAHCFNEAAALELKSQITAGFPTAEVVIYPCRGLCSFYAERGGLLVGFEKAEA